MPKLTRRQRRRRQYVSRETSSPSPTQPSNVSRETLEQKIDAHAKKRDVFFSKNTRASLIYAIIGIIILLGLYQYNRQTAFSERLLERFTSQEDVSRETSEPLLIENNTEEEIEAEIPE
jgi:hypothetical protein